MSTARITSFILLAFIGGMVIGTTVMSCDSAKTEQTTTDSTATAPVDSAATQGAVGGVSGGDATSTPTIK
jgi:hypothetical protein